MVEKQEQRIEHKIILPRIWLQDSPFSNFYLISLFGYLHRISEERIVKKVYKWKPMLTRPLGSPKNRWEDDIRNDLKKLKIKSWTSCIQDHNILKLYVEKGKTFNG